MGTYRSHPTTGAGFDVHMLSKASMTGDEGLWRAWIYEGDAAELRGAGAAVDCNIGGNWIFAHRHYTTNKTMP